MAPELVVIGVSVSLTVLLLGAALFLRLLPTPEYAAVVVTHRVAAGAVRGEPVSLYGWYVGDRVRHYYLDLEGVIVALHPVHVTVSIQRKDGSRDRASVFHIVRIPSESDWDIQA